MQSRRSHTREPSRSRSPSPSDSFDSTLSSSSTLYSPISSSPPRTPSPPPAPVPAVFTPPMSMYNRSGTRPRRVTPPQRFLGAIDEDSPAVQPDLPLYGKNANPMNKLHVYAAVKNSKHRTTVSRKGKPPSNVFDMVMGPNGERFGDLRLNKKVQNNMKGWKKLTCFG